MDKEEKKEGVMDSIDLLKNMNKSNSLIFLKSHCINTPNFQIVKKIIQIGIK